MKSDIEIARSCKMKRIEDVAKSVGIASDELEHYGKYMAKVPLSLIDEDQVSRNKLILVTSISPTRAGIGKPSVAAPKPVTILRKLRSLTSRTRLQSTSFSVNPSLRCW